MTIDFTAKSFPELLSQADLYAKELLPEWISRDDNDLNWVTVKTVAWLLSIAMFYIDLGVNEQDPNSVQIYKNAIKLCNKYGYPVKKYSGARTTITVVIEAQTSEYIINRGEKFVVSASGMTFVSLEDVVYPVGVTSKDINVAYGSFLRTTLGISNGQSFQKFLISNTTIQNNGVDIFMDEGSGEEKWERTTSLLMSREEDKNYRLIMGEDEKYEIHFGDNKSGKIPQDTVTIYAELLLMGPNSTTDNFGNIPTGNIDSSTLPEVVSVTQNEDANGGTDKETIEEMQRNLPQWISTADRIVTSLDAEYLARRVAGVADASASISGIILNVFVVPTGGGMASSALRDAVYDYLKVRKIIQLVLNIITASQITINADLNIKVEDNKEQEVIKSSVRTAITNYLNNSKDVGRTIAIMDIYSLVSNVVGVSSAKLISFYKNGDTPTADDIVLSINEVSSSGILNIVATGGIV